MDKQILQSSVRLKVGTGKYPQLEEQSYKRLRRVYHWQK
jgi:hypothetical protein